VVLKPQRLNNLIRDDAAGLVLPPLILGDLLQCMGPPLAHLGDGVRRSWRPVVEVVLPPLWHQGHTPRRTPHDAVRRELSQAHLFNHL
jgi:hypothetical protein